MNPRVIVDLTKLRENITFLTGKMKDAGMSISAITKVHNADPEIISLFEEFPEIQYFGDSRIENLKSYQHSQKQKILIRIPMQSELEETVQYADMSFHSEIETLRLLNEKSQKFNKIHDVLLMVDLGDLREGFFSEAELMEAVKEIMGFEHLRLVGLGVNLTCYGAIIPEAENLQRLVDLKVKIEAAYPVKLSMISGGNSSSIYMLDHESERLPEGINNLRIGEAYLLGRETAYCADYEEMHQDVFTLTAEIVELKEKPSLPIGRIGVDAFGESPVYVDKGPRLRGIVAIGKQDVAPSALTLFDQKLEIVGASSDHLIIDFTDSDREYRVGDEVRFSLDYGSLLSTFTSKYVKKEYLK